MSGSGDGGNDVDDILDLIQKGLDFARDHEDAIARIVDNEETESITVKEPLAEAHVTDEKVEIVAEATGGNSGDMNVHFNEGHMLFSFGGNKYRAEIPNDVVEESIEAEYNNGVLRVTLDRMNKESATEVEVTSDTDESIEDIVGEDSIEDGSIEDEENGGDEDGSDG